MKTIRTFIAIEASPEVVAQAERLIEALRPTSANVRWVAAANMHWTVKFLGDVPTREIPQVCDVLADAVAGLAPFELEACGAGAFPDASRPRTVWLGARDGVEAFVALHDHIEEALELLDFRPEHRRFRPHITLGRVRRSPDGVAELGELIAQRANFAAGRMTVTEAVVFSSQLERSGPVYEIMGRANLGG